MAFDGITISNIINELNEKVVGGRIDKIYQPEKDEIILTIRSFGNVYKLLITSNASQPRLHITDKNKNNPMQPPLFCMVLRKHIASGKIIKITQPNFERIISIHIESINELGDYSTKQLIIEIMGKHSNIILTDENLTILDCIKHISHEQSSVREVLPGKTYCFPPSKDKINTLNLNKDEFLKILKENLNLKIQKFIYQSYNGISPVMASEICFRAKINSDTFTEELNEEQILNIYNEFYNIVSLIKTNQFSPETMSDKNKKLVEFSPIEMKQFNFLDKKKYDSISELLESYYSEKDISYRINQKSQDLKKLITQNIERCVKKKDIQIKTMKQISKRDTYKLYGELITANIYAVKKGMTEFNTINFYDENCLEISIPLDTNLTPSENAQKYFKKYNKEKRTFSALKTQIKQNDEELKYLDTILNSLQNSSDEQDIAQIRDELINEGYIKRKKQSKAKQTQKKAKPIHFISSDGYDIFVGKNNIQNDELTLKFAKSNDMWLHTKDIPGSHVIVVSNGKNIPDNTLNEAANLAAYYSKGKNSSLVPVDYTLKKNVKKPSGAKPGMVIYETNKTAYITPSEEIINKIEKK